MKTLLFTIVGALFCYEALQAAPNLTPYQPPGWSDEIVVSKTMGTHTDSSPLKTTDTLYVDWAAINNGSKTAPERWVTELYVDGVLRATWVADRKLKVNSYTSVEDYSIGSLAAGSHTIRIKTDATGAIKESNETDNEYTKTINVETTLAPDIRIEPLTITFSDITGGSIASASPSAASSGMQATPGSEATPSSAGLDWSDPTTQIGEVQPDEVVVRFRDAEAAKLHSHRLATVQWDNSAWLEIPAQSGVKPLPRQAMKIRPFRSGAAAVDRVMKDPKMADIAISRATPLNAAQIGQITTEVLKAARPHGPLGLFYIQVPPGTDLRAACLELMEREDVIYAHPNPVYHVESVPNDPLFNRMWNLTRLKLPTAWDISGNTPGAVRVCVVDTGVRVSHQELAGRTADPTDVYLANGDAYADTNPDNDDESGHGTACAGIIGAIRDNNSLVAGIAPVTLIPVNASAGGSSIINYTDGIYWGVDHDADVISLSFGSFRSAPSQVELDAAAYAQAHGVVVCAAAGNQNGDADFFFPAAIPYYISVGAVDNDDIRVRPPKWWWGSNFGDAVDICAPGQGNVGPSLDSILTLGNASNTAWINSFGGTSSATPQVAGICALLKHVNPALNAVQIRAILESTAEDQIGDPAEDVPGWDPYHGHGLVNAAAALTAALGSFFIHNDGNGPLSVNSISLDTEAPWITWLPSAPFEVLPGQNRLVTVSVDFGMAPPGQTTRRLLVQSNDLDESPYPGGVNLEVNRLCTSVPWVRGMAPGTVRNNYSGWVGMRLRVGANPLTVQALGRIYRNGNSGNHTLRLVAASNGAIVASVVWTPTGGVDNEIKYVALTSPVSLPANTEYYLASQEVSGGDQWHDANTIVTTSSAAAVLSSIYSANGTSWTAFGGVGQTYGPVSFQYCGAASDTCTPVSWVRGMTLGTVRNNYSGWVGMRLRVGANPLTVQALGRIYRSGNSGNHTLRLVAASTGATVASGVWTPVGGVDNEIKYVALPSPVVLPANTEYYLASQEVSGGDQWHDANTIVTTSSAAAVLSSIYSGNGTTWTAFGGAGQTYGPVSLQYCEASSSPSAMAAALLPASAIPPRIEALVLLENVGIRLTLSGNPGQHCGVFASEDLQNWSSIGESTLDEEGRAEFTYFEEATATARFYRIQGY